MAWPSLGDHTSVNVHRVDRILRLQVGERPAIEGAQGEVPQLGMRAQRSHHQERTRQEPEPADGAARPPKLKRAPRIQTPLRADRAMRPQYARRPDQIGTDVVREEEPAQRMQDLEDAYHSQG